MNQRDQERIARAAWAYLCEPNLELHELVTAEGPTAAWAQLRQRPYRPAGLRSELATLDAARLPRLAQQAAQAAATTGQVVIPTDDQWPPQLADLATTTPADDQPPALLCLFLAGQAQLGRLLSSSVTITGARAATGYGTHVAHSLAYEVASHGWTVLASGGFGIDASTHRGALAAGGATIAVLPGGLDRPHPAAHTGLFEAITATGLLASMFAPGTPPTRHRMTLTRQLPAALSSGTVIVEATARSGALHTLTQAATLGKPAMVVPGPVTSTASAGCHHALRADRRIRPVTTAEEIIAELTAAAGHTHHRQHRSAEPGAAGNVPSVAGHMRRAAQATDEGTKLLSGQKRKADPVMSQRYELGTAAGTACEVVEADNPWHTIWDHELPPAPGVRALVIGNPWASAYAVLGTLGELEQFVTRQMVSLHQAYGGRHADPAVTFDPAQLADWLATHAERLQLTGHYTAADNIASRLGDLLCELRSQPRIWRTGPEVGRITVCPTALAEADPAGFGAVLTIEVGPVRLATDHLTGADLTGLSFDGDELPSVPWPQAAQRAITAAAEAVNDLVARWRAATAAPTAAGQPIPAGSQPGRDHHTR